MKQAVLKGEEVIPREMSTLNKLMEAALPGEDRSRMMWACCEY